MAAYRKQPVLNICHVERYSDLILLTLLFWRPHAIPKFKLFGLTAMQHGSPHGHSPDEGCFGGPQLSIRYMTEAETEPFLLV